MIALPGILSALMAWESAAASGEIPSDYLVVSPKAGLLWMDSTTHSTWGISFSRYPDYNLGYGIAVNQMFDGPELELTGRSIYLNLGLYAGPMFCRKGVGVTMGAFTSLVYFGDEFRILMLPQGTSYSLTFFVPFWWRNGKFWDVSGVLEDNSRRWKFSMSGYH